MKPLLAPGFDRCKGNWQRDYWLDGSKDISLYHHLYPDLYLAIAFFGEMLAESPRHYCPVPHGCGSEKGCPGIPSRKPHGGKFLLTMRF
jgi:hypothetical protein